MYAQQIAQARAADLRRQADAYRLARHAKATRPRPSPRTDDPRGRWVKAA